MPLFVLKDFSAQLDREPLRQRLGIRSGNKRAGRFAEILTDAERVARPKAVYKEAFVESIDGDSVVISGITFNSRVMRSNLEKIGRVFPYAATCGTEIEEWSQGFTNVLEKYWAEGIKANVLYLAMEALNKHIVDHFETGKLAFMNPGSLPDWPIGEQVPLISMLGDIQDLIGVRLNAALMMGPVNSVTGIFFPTETGYENCQLCPRKNCPNRRAPFDAKLYKEKLG